MSKKRGPLLTRSDIQNSEHNELNLEQVDFVTLRADWYNGNSIMPRLVRSCLTGKRNICFCGFPRQWLPVFEWYGLKWKQSSQPKEYIPIFSDLEEQAIVEIIAQARLRGGLRILVESVSMSDSVISDFLYIIDNTIPLPNNLLQIDMAEIHNQNEYKRRRRLMLNGWQSYGRPSIRMLDEKVAGIRSDLHFALVLPCALRRPYDKSRTHKKIFNELKARGYDLSIYHKIVVTSLGILPEEVWSEPEVLTYDAGVPDIYRILRLARGFFSKQKYECVLSCLQFEPYSDVLRIMYREGIINRLEQVKIGRPRHFYIRPR